MAKVDFRGLVQRGAQWWLDFRFPKGCVVSELAGRRIRHALGADLKAACATRDRVLGPLLAASNEAELCQTVARLVSDASRRLSDALALAAAEIPSLRKVQGVRIGCGADDPTLREVLFGWISRLGKMGAVKKSTVVRYAIACRLLVFAMGEKADSPVNVLTMSDFQNAVDTMLDLPRAWAKKEKEGLNSVLSWGEGRAKITKAGARFALVTVQTAWRNALELGAVRTPCPPLSKLVAIQEQTHKNCPSEEEAEALCRLPNKSGIRGALAWEFLPWLGRYTGCRLGELAQLTHESFKIEAGLLCVEIRGDLKTKSSARIIPISDRLRPQVEKLLAQAPAKGRFFLEIDEPGKTGLRPGAKFSKWFGQAASKIGDFTFHCWRAYAASNMLKNGVNLIDSQLILGHSCELTHASYVAPDLPRLKQAVDKIP